MHEEFLKKKIDAWRNSATSYSMLQHFFNLETLDMDENLCTLKW